MEIQQSKIGLAALITVIVVGGAIYYFISAKNSGTASPTQKKTALSIKVDANAKLGKMAYIFRSGMIGNVWPGTYPLNKFLRDQLPGELLMAWDLDFGSLAELPSLEDFLAKLPASNLSLWAKEWERAGGEVNIETFGTPKWLRTVSGDFDNVRMTPPKDLDAWSDYIRGIADYFKNTIKINVGYQTWDEPDSHFFRGTLDDYLTLHKATVEAVKSVDAAAKIFGPGSSIFSGENYKEDLQQPLIYHFLEYSRKNNLPLDGLSWHVFSLVPGEYADNVSRARSWADQFGYPNIKLDINSWGPLSGNYNTEEVASFVIPALAEMRKAGIEQHVFFNLFEHWQGGQITSDSEFTEGGFGIFTKNFVIKPVYNSLRALAIFSGKTEGQTTELIQVSMLEDDYVTVLASRGIQHTRILLSNFVPAGKMLEAILRSAIKSCLLAKGYKGQLKSILLAVQSGQTLAPEIQTNIDTCKAKVEAKKDEILYFSQNPREINLTLSNLPSGSSTLKKYLIDTDHSNSCRYNKKTEPVPTDKECGVGGAIDRQIVKAKQEAISKNDKNVFYAAIDIVNNQKEVALEMISQKFVNITNGEYTETLLLQPNSVALLEIISAGQGLGPR